ncbi:MAG: ABC transporter permease [Bacteroidetes bacterium]|nr:ABC transporter permease [Bacteroidota bacterium]
MLPFLLNRFRYSFLILLGVVTVVFFLFNVLPGDPARLTMGQRSDLQSLENVRRELHLDKPMMTRYFLFLNDLSPISWLKNDKLDNQKYHFWKISPAIKQHFLAIKKPYLGRSYRTKRDVSETLLEALPGTVILAISAMFLATILGLLLGILAALKKDSWIDTTSIVASVAGISMPSFFAGLIIAYVFGYLLHSVTGLSMTGSLWNYDPITGPSIAWQNLLLPALALGVRPLAIITQLTRSAMLDVLGQDYIRTAYAKGLSKFEVIFKHALPNALNPVVTAVSGWLAELLAGSFFVEYIFGWKGVGKLTVDALDKFDFPIVMGAVLLTAFLFILINLLTDILYSKLDPRVRLHS